MKALVLINLCAAEYQDTGFERIAKTGSGAANWLAYLNDAQRAVVLVRPDANSVTESVKLAAGTRQSLPTGAMRLLDVTRNMGADGNTPGDTIAVVERMPVDNIEPGWHYQPTKVKVQEILYDEKKAPLTFWSRQRIPTSPDVYIELMMSKTPTDVTDADTGDITIPDVYSAPIQAWMLYRGFSLATQAVNQFQRASAYQQSFFGLLGVKLRGDLFDAATASPMYPSARGA